MTDLTEKCSANRLARLENGIAALNARVAALNNSPERIAAALTLSPRLTCTMTGESLLAYLPTPRVWLSRENGKWRTRSDKQVAAMFRSLLASDGRTISQAMATSIERAARRVFARVEFPEGSA